MIAIVARSENGVIGKDGGLPWRCKGDLQFFKRTTMDRKILVGRTTFDGLPPLKGREIYVLTRNPAASFESATAITQLDQVPADTILCGGAAVYDLLMEQCEEVLVTTVKTEVEGDTFFPDIDLDEWLLADRVDHPADEKNEFAYSFERYDRP